MRRWVTCRPPPRRSCVPIRGYAVRRGRGRRQADRERHSLLAVQPRPTSGRPELPTWCRWTRHAGGRRAATQMRACRPCWWPRPPGKANGHHRRILTAVIWPNVLLLVVTLVLVYCGVRLGLRPLDALGRQIDQRASSFSAVRRAGVPAGRGPLVAAMNRLMRRPRDRWQGAAGLSPALRTSCAPAGRPADPTGTGGRRPAAGRVHGSNACAGPPQPADSLHPPAALARSSPEAGGESALEQLDLAELLGGVCSSDSPSMRRCTRRRTVLLRTRRRDRVRLMLRGSPTGR